MYTAQGRRTRAYNCRWGAAWAAAVLILAGCTGYEVVTNRMEGSGNRGAQTYSPYAAMNGTNLLVVINNPFPADTNNAAVANVVATFNPMQRYRFALAPPPDWNQYTVVLAFGQTPIGNQDLCHNAHLPLRPAPESQTAIVLNLCLQEQLVTEVIGHAPKALAPDDPNFTRLISQATSDLFELRDIDNNRIAPPLFVF